MSEVKVPAARLASWPVAAAIAINLVPIIGVLFWGWSAFALIFLYWLENVVIGARILASMAANTVIAGQMNWFGLLFFGGFFTLHYGLFCLVHGSFVVGLFGGAAVSDDLFDLSGAAMALFAQHPNLLVGLVSIVLWQVVQFVLFIVRGEVRETNPLALMGAPYPRIIVLHLTIIFGGFLLMLLNQPVAGLVVLALIKTGFDVAEALGKAPKFGAAMPGETHKRRGGGNHPGSLQGPSTRR
jgi:hypothetical protein